MGDHTVEDISSSENQMVLRYRGDVWRYSGLMLLNLVGTGDRLQIGFSIMNGQFTISGVGAKKPRTLDQGRD
jgi:hypothetical protein